MDRATFKEKIYLQLANNISKLSTCKRLQVGAVIIDKEGHPKGWGYNGTPQGTDNDCECDDVTKEQVIHAEINAILHSSMPVAGSTLYVTHSPCLRCAAMLIQLGITKVVYENDYRSTDGINFLKENGVCVLKLESLLSA